MIGSEGLYQCMNHSHILDCTDLFHKRKGFTDRVTNSKICCFVIGILIIVISFIVSIVSIIVIIIITSEVSFQSIEVNIVVVKLCIVKCLLDFLNKDARRCRRNHLDEVACTEVNGMLHAPWKLFVRKINYCIYK